MSAEHYAQGLEDLATWVRANAEALDFDGVELTDCITVPLIRPAAWVALAAALDGDDATVPESGYVTLSRWFGPIELRLGTTADIDAAGRGLTGAIETGVRL